MFCGLLTKLLKQFAMYLVSPLLFPQNCFLEANLNCCSTAGPPVPIHPWSLVSMLLAARLPDNDNDNATLSKPWASLSSARTASTTLQCNSMWLLYLCRLFSTHGHQWVLLSASVYLQVLEDTLRLLCTRLLPCHLAMWLIDHLPACLRPRRAAAAACQSRWCRICNCPNRLICRPDRGIISSSGG